MALDSTQAPGGSVRRQAVAATASAVAAIALAVGMAGRGCGIDEDTPTGVVEALAGAIRADDAQAFYDLLGPGTRAKLAAAAKRATDLAGGAKRFTPIELISLGEHAEFSMPHELVVEEQSPSRAIVAGTTTDGDVFRITVVREDSRWRIELPTYGDAR